MQANQISVYAKQHKQKLFCVAMLSFLIFVLDIHTFKPIKCNWITKNLFSCIVIADKWSTIE